MINNGKKSFGIVFNVDPHDKPGQHWYHDVCRFSR